MNTADSKNLPFVFIACILAISTSLIVLLPINPKYSLAVGIGLLYIFVSQLTVGLREGLLYLLVFIIPFQLGKFFVYPHEPGVWISIRLIDFVVLGLYVLWIVEAISQGRKNKIRIDKSTTLFLLLLVLFSFASSFNALDKKLCIYQSWILFSGFLIFFYVAHYPIKKRSLYIILVILTVGVLIQSVIGFIQWHMGTPLGLKMFGEPLDVRVQKLSIQSVFRISGTLPSPNMLWFMYMDFTLPILAAFLMFRMRILYKVVLFAIFIFAFFISSLAFSRAGLLSFFVALGVLLSINLFRQRFNIKMIIKALLIIAFPLSVLFFMSDIIISRFISYDYGSLQMRIPLMEIALNIIRSHPFLGIGAGNYVLVMYIYDVSVRGITSFFFYQVHNLYLLIIAELGVFALASFILFILSVLKKAWSVIISEPPGIGLILTMGSISGLCGFCIHGLVESISLGRLVILWFCCGLIVGFSRSVRSLGPQA